jgi:hypothetical protein
MRVGYVGQEHEIKANKHPKTWEVGDELSKHQGQN